MGLNKVIDILEADYGCEECPPDGPHALLVLDSGERVEVSERWIREHETEPGKYVWRGEGGSIMKAVRVAAAVIKVEREAPMILATQRGYGAYKDGWEFPGGKLEEGETPEQAIVREIKEELDISIVPESCLDTVEYDYPDFHLSMACFLCTIAEGEPVLKEHEAARWITKEDLDSVDWLPADITVIDKVRDIL